MRATPTTIRNEPSLLSRLCVDTLLSNVVNWGYIAGRLNLPKDIVEGIRLELNKKILNEKNDKLSDQLAQRTMEPSMNLLLEPYNVSQQDEIENRSNDFSNYSRFEWETDEENSGLMADHFHNNNRLLETNNSFDENNDDDDNDDDP